MSGHFSSVPNRNRQPAMRRTWCTLYLVATVASSRGGQPPPVEMLVISGDMAVSISKASGQVTTLRYGGHTRQARDGAGVTTIPGATARAPPTVARRNPDTICISSVLGVGVNTVHVEDCWSATAAATSNNTVQWTSTISSPDAGVWSTQLNRGTFQSPKCVAPHPVVC